MADKEWYSLKDDFGENGEPDTDISGVMLGIIKAIGKGMCIKKRAMDKNIPKELHKYFK